MVEIPFLSHRVKSINEAKSCTGCADGLVLVEDKCKDSCPKGALGLGVAWGCWGGAVFW